VFTKYLVLPKKTATVNPQDIGANRDQWIQAWTAAVLH
jgi:ABC-type thiamine transport system substrate-binding protein